MRGRRIDEATDAKRDHQRRRAGVVWSALAACGVIAALAACVIVAESRMAQAAAGEPIPGIDVSLEQVPGGIAANGCLADGAACVSDPQCCTGTCYSGVCGLLPDSNHGRQSECDAGVTAAATQKVACVGKVVGKAQGRGVNVTAENLERCQEKYDAKVTKALTAGDCFMQTQSADATDAEVNGCVRALVGPCIGKCAGGGNDGVKCQYDADCPSGLCACSGATGCPATIGMLIRAGCSADAGLTDPGNLCNPGSPTATTLSEGWTGIRHAVDTPDHYSISVDVTCAGTEAGSCGVCTVDGVSSVDPQYGAFARCKADPSVQCTQPFLNDAVCPLGGLCTFFVGAPLAISSGGTPTCSLSSLATDIVGVADPDAGTSQLHLDLRETLYLGLSQVQPCPICTGDSTPRDASRGGTCQGGSRDGLSCDVQSFDPTHAGDPAHNGVSLDCPPAALANISGAGLVVDLTLTTGTSSLPFSNVCDAPYDGPGHDVMCACGVCSGNTSFPCRDNSTCSDAGFGTCTSSGSGPARQPNGCTGYACDNIGATDRGECGVSTPDDTFCDGFASASGRGVLSCSSNADCDALDAICPGTDCGTCQLAARRSCFLDPIVTTGTPSATNPVLAGTFCLAPTANAGVNATAGLPGPGEVKVAARITLGY